MIVKRFWGGLRQKTLNDCGFAEDENSKALYPDARFVHLVCS